MDLNLKRLAAMTTVFALAGCGGGGGGSGGNGGGGSGGAPQPQTVGGTASGVDGSGLTLQINGANDITVNANGSFTFGALPSGTAYTVTVRTQPSSPRQSCSVTNGTGTIASGAVTNVAVSCRSLVGKFLYVPNLGSHDVSAYAINTTTGALTAIGAAVPTGNSPLSVSTDPTERFIYTSNSGFAAAPLMPTAPSFSGYTINSTTGELSPVTGSPFFVTGTGTPAGSTQTALTFDASGKFAYLTARISGSTSVDGVAIDATGSLAPIPSSPFIVSPAASTAAPGTFNRAGTRYYTTFGAGILIFDVDATTGGLSLSGSTAAGSLTPAILTKDPADKYLYATSIFLGNVAAFAIDATTGALTAVPGSPPATGGSGVVAVSVHRSGRFAYTLNSNSVPNPPTPSTVAAFSIDETTGALAAASGSPFPTGGSNASNLFTTCVLEPRGRFLYVNNTGSNSISAFSIDQASGQLSAVTGSPFATDAMPSTPIPDPSGKFVYVASRVASNVSSYAIDQNTGALTLINTLPTGTSPTSVRVVGLQ